MLTALKADKAVSLDKAAIFAGTPPHFGPVYYCCTVAAANVTEGKKRKTNKNETHQKGVKTPELVL